MSDDAIPEAPSDNTTLTAVLAGYAEAGYDGQFSVAGDGVELRCVSCGATSDPSAVELHGLRRLEGASDPADMAAVLALACPVCGRHGTSVVMFGPESTAAEAELLRRVRDQRFDADIDPDGGRHEHPGSDD